jgi:hypothetical protein
MECTFFEATGRYARLVLRIPGSASELEVDLLKEGLGPGYVTVRVEPEASVHPDEPRSQDSVTRGAIPLRRVPKPRQCLLSR